MGEFERYAAQRIIDKARAAGVDVPTGLAAADLCVTGSYAARRWAAEHPDDDGRGCCYGDAMNGPEGCTCWRPVFAVDQAAPVPPQRPSDITARPAMCGDCAFRPGSPERSESWTEEALYDSARSGVPFWCHQGMRRPVRWEHPDGRVVEGSPDDWQPPIVAGIPYRADGSPGLLCAGWTAVAAKAAREVAAALDSDGAPVAAASDPETDGGRADG